MTESMPQERQHPGANGAHPGDTTISSRLGTIVPDTIDCPIWCSVRHNLDPDFLARAGNLIHEHHVVDRPDLRVVVEQADVFAAVEQPGWPATSAHRDPVVIAVDIAHACGGANDVQEIAPAAAAELAEALLRAVQIATAKVATA